MKKKEYNFYAISIAALRKAWLHSPFRKECLDRNKIYEECYKKDGTLSKKKKILGWKCERCGDVFPKTKIQIHHIRPLGKQPFELKFNDYLKSLFCSADKLACLCKKCHNTVHKEKDEKFLDILK
jgi:predicted HNH restriction endonuclease